MPFPKEAFSSFGFLKHSVTCIQKLESRPTDALALLDSLDSLETVTYYVHTENLKKVTDSVSDNLKSRDISATKTVTKNSQNSRPAETNPCFILFYLSD